MTITDLIPVQYRLLAAGLAIAVLIALSAGGGAWVSSARWSAYLATAKQAHAEALSAIERRQSQAQAQARSEEQRRQEVVEGIRKDAHDQIEQAKADVAAATARANSLQQQAALLAGRLSCSPSNYSPAAGSPPTNAPALLLAEVLSRIDARAGETCERSYDSLSVRAVK